jgi:hypothetical protein
MQLRDHPLLTYRGIRSWPPVWTLIRGNDTGRPRGEVGTLKEIHVSAISPTANSGATRSYNRIFLFIDHDRKGYLGCLMMENRAFCEHLAKLLCDHYGHTVAEIGGARSRRQSVTALSVPRPRPAKGPWTSSGKSDEVSP